MYTEEEAKLKWCPFARTVEHGGNGTSFPRNRVAIISSEPPTELAESLLNACCIGSACMAWRRVPASEMGDLDTGYCGLAGKP